MVTQKKEKVKHLGRGLQALLGPITQKEEGQSLPIPIATIGAKSISDNRLRDGLRQIRLDTISANPYQPRTVWGQEQLEDLASSIKSQGVIQPIIVRPTGAGFELIAGERRFRAAQLAGLETIPALLRAATDEEMLELALIENIHRENLNSIERARAYQNYIESFSLTQSEAAAKLGENRSVLANHLRLLELPEEIKKMLSEGALSMGHGRAILALPTDDLRRKLANRALAGRLSVREVERLVRKYLTGEQQSKSVTNSKPSHILDLESKLSSELGTKVNIDTRKNGERGKISIEFYSLDEFDRLMEKIGVDMLEEV